MQHEIPAAAIPLVQNLVQSPTFKTLLEAVRSRTPGRVTPEQSSETVAHQAFLRQGFEQALETIERIAFEVQDEDQGIPAVLDPRD